MNRTFMFNFRTTREGVELIDQLRGNWSRSEWVRRAVHDAANRPSPLTGPTEPSPQSGTRGPIRTYETAHARLNQERGAANTHDCVDCGRRAADWSYQNACPDEMTDDKGRRFCPHTTHYEPRCRVDHKKFDGGPR